MNSPLGCGRIIRMGPVWQEIEGEATLKRRLLQVKIDRLYPGYHGHLIRASQGERPVSCT